MTIKVHRIASFMGIALALVLSINFEVIGQATNPQVSKINSSVLPRGCSYSLDDWKGNLLLWAPYSAFLDQDNSLIVNLDGQNRRIPINSRNDNFISAYDGVFYIEIQTPLWLKTALELKTAKATMKVTNTQAKTQANLIVRASEGC